MIELSAGLIMTGAGALLALIFLILLLAAAPRFKRQRRRLLNQIEEV